VDLFTHLNVSCLLHLHRPKALALELAIVDNIGQPDECTEIVTQTQRLAILIETKYLDSSLVPNDPDRSLAEEDATAQSARQPAVPQRIKWNLMDEPDEPEPLVPSSSSMSMSTPTLLPMVEDFHLQVSKLPHRLQALDPMTLQMITSDSFVLPSLLRSDGSIDEYLLDLLINSNNIEEYRQSVNLLNSSSIQPSSTLSWSNPSKPYSLDGRDASDWKSPFDHRTLSDSSLFYSREVAPQYESYDSKLDRQYDVFRDRTERTVMSSGLNLATVDGSMMAKARFPTSKGSVACKFFNTPRGCANGDRCPFGHFRSVGAPVSSIITPVSSAARRGPGMKR
jgi:hypothetical protein